MKLNKWFFGAAAMAMMASCSDNYSGEPTPAPEATGSGYISIALGLPNNAGTRANDEFDDGTKDEYEVSNLGIIFFTGREDEAKFYKAHIVPKENWDKKGESDDQITSIRSVTFPVDITENSETLWALAVINYSNIMRIDKTGEVILNSDNSKFNGSIKEFMKLTTTASLSTNENFFMTNTPYVTMPGSGNFAPTGFVHFLAMVDKEKIKETENDAKNNPAAEIFVERAVAKVIVTTSDDMESVSDIEKIEWVLDNTEPTSYVARNLVPSYDATEAPEWLTYDTANKELALYGYRFAGNTAFENGKNMYRIYFGIDPNGNGRDEKNPGTALNVLTDADLTVAGKYPFKSVGASYPQYCYENTFDVAHQDYHNTTRALLKVTYKDGEFYTRGIDRKTKYTFNDAAATLAHFVLENKTVVDTWSEHSADAITITMTDLEYKDKTAENDWFRVEYEVKDGRLIVSDFTLYDGGKNDEGNKKEVPLKLEGDNTKDTVIADINSMATFNAYVNGVSYYAIRIKHFGDDLTPWVEPKNADGTLMDTPNTDIAYGITRDGETTAKNNYLGRYGVLRNNWYELNINSINKFGEPTIGDLPLDGTPDDKTEPEQSIACKINILSWAKRSQDVDL